jgi:hypothetical protein
MGLMTTAPGRDTVAYLVKCALPAGKTLTKVVGGTSYTFPGSLGLAPQWETGACDTNCQQYLSACMLAHINTSGEHISLWLDSDNAAVGWGQNASYPYQEGSFFGNIFVSPPQAYYCNGKDFDLGVVAGRLGATQSGTPYVNPYGSSSAQCSVFCAAHGTDGFNSCPVWNPYATFSHVVTVWRNFDPNTQYKICNKSGGLCLDNAGSTADKAKLVQSAYKGASSQKWNIVVTSTGKYKLTSVASAKAVATLNGGTASGTALMQTTYTGASTQIWTILSLYADPGFYKIASSSNANLVVSPNGTTPEVDTYIGADTQKWQINVAN